MYWIFRYTREGRFTGYLGTQGKEVYWIFRNTREGRCTGYLGTQGREGVLDI